MKNGTENLKNFINYIEAYEGLHLTECACVNTGYKVFLTGDVMFHNDHFQSLAELHDVAWMAALTTRRL